MTCIIFEGDYIGSEKCKTEKEIKKFFDSFIRELDKKFETIIFKRKSEEFLLKTPHNK